MEHYKYMRVKQALLGVALELSPGGTERVEFIHMVDTAQAEGAEPMEVIKLMLGGISDGIKYGNWPSRTVQTVSDILGPEDAGLPVAERELAPAKVHPAFESAAASGKQLSPDEEQNILDGISNSDESR